MSAHMFEHQNRHETRPEEFMYQPFVANSVGEEDEEKVLILHYKISTSSLVSSVIVVTVVPVVPSPRFEASYLLTISHSLSKVSCSLCRGKTYRQIIIFPLLIFALARNNSLLSLTFFLPNSSILFAAAYSTSSG